MSEQSRYMLVAPPLMETNPAFDRAAALAKAEGAALHIVAFDYLEGLATANLVDEDALQVMRVGYVERHRQWLEDQARMLRQQQITVTTEVVWIADPLEEILIHLNEQPMSLLIKALENHSRLSRIFFTPLDIQLLRQCPVPLHFVRHAKRALPRKIIAAVDPFHGSEQYKGFNDRILREAVRLATVCNADLEVVYAYGLGSFDPQGFDYDTSSTLFSSAAVQSLFDAQGQAFNELAERNGIPAEQRHMIMGNPAKVLCSYAEASDIDIIVMGRVGHPGPGRFVGSTVEQLLYTMPCSAWIVSPQVIELDV